MIRLQSNGAMRAIIGYAGLFTLLLPLLICEGSVSPARAQSGSPDLKSAPLPTYRPGTKFVYSDGTWETVLKVGPDGVTWNNHRNFTSTGSADFTYKRFKWQTKDRYGYREFEQTRFLLAPRTTSLWPLKVGNKTRFDENGRWFDEFGYEHQYDSFWSCEVMGTETVSVGAGQFDTWKITCRRYPDKFTSTSKVREYRTWYYAPSVGHWVIEIRDYNGFAENRSKELVAVLPDLLTFTADQDDILLVQKQFQNALESNPNGVTSVWENFQQQLVIGVTPVKSYKHPDGTICRQYSQIIAKEGLPYEYPGIACRTPKGRWDVPRR